MGLKNKTIGRVDAEKLWENWRAKVSSKNNLYPCFNAITQASTAANDERIIGFQMSYEQYVHMINTIGNQRLWIYFGCTDDDRFCCTVFTSTSLGVDGMVLDGYLQIEEPVFLSQIQGDKDGELSWGQSTGRVPKQLVNTLTSDWDAQIKQKTVAYTSFKNPMFQNLRTLKGYSYSIQESIDVLETETKDNRTNVIEKVLILFTNHRSTTMGKANMDTFGVVLASCGVKSGQDNGPDNLDILSAFYDVGSPCPPTCPPPDDDDDQ